MAEKIKIEMTLDELAAIQHDIWSKWMVWLFSCCVDERVTPPEVGCDVIPVYKKRRWSRQMYTDYADLSEAEKESDRKVVREFLLKQKEENTYKCTDVTVDDFIEWTKTQKSERIYLAIESLNNRLKNIENS